MVSTVWDINKGERKAFDRRMPTDIYPFSSVFSTLLSLSSLLDISSFPHHVNLETKFPMHFTSKPTKVCSHSMQMCLHMRQHEPTFIDIACFSGTNLRHAQNTEVLRHTDIGIYPGPCPPPPYNQAIYISTYFSSYKALTSLCSVITLLQINKTRAATVKTTWLIFLFCYYCLSTFDSRLVQKLILLYMTYI